MSLAVAYSPVDLHPAPVKCAPRCVKSLTQVSAGSGSLVCPGIAHPCSCDVFFGVPTCAATVSPSMPAHRFTSQLSVSSLQPKRNVGAIQAYVWSMHGPVSSPLGPTYEVDRDQSTFLSSTGLRVSICVKHVSIRACRQNFQQALFRTSTRETKNDVSYKHLHHNNAAL